MDYVLSGTPVWEAESYKQLNDDRHMTRYRLSTHTHKTHLSRHIHSISTKPSGFHCNPLCVPHSLKRKRLKLSTCSSVEVFLSVRLSNLTLFVSQVSIPSQGFFFPSFFSQAVFFLLLAIDLDSVSSH